MICRANGYNDGTQHYIGNGRMIVFGNGAELSGIRGSCYSSATLGALVISESHESESHRLKGCGIYTHNIYLSGEALGGTGDDIPDITFTDFMHPDKQIFIRNFKGIGRLTMKLVRASYVRSSKYKCEVPKKCGAVVCYACTIPAGTQYYESLFQKDESRLLVAATGDIRFDGETLELREGEGSIIITAGTPEGASSSMYHALSEIHRHECFTENEIYLGALHKYSSFINRCPGAVCESLLVSLLERQSLDGGILSSHSMPLADIGSFYYTARAFAALSLEKELRRLADYYINRYSFLTEGGSTGSGGLTALGTDGMLPDVNRGRTEACLLKGLICVYGYIKPENSAIQVMKGAFYSALGMLNKGMVAFSGSEPELSYGIIPREYIFHGSLEASVLVITACENFILYCRLHGIKLRDGGESPAKRLASARAEFAAGFIRDDRIYADSLRLEGAGKRKRFIYSRCWVCAEEGAFAPLTWLDKDRNGRYLCLSCLNKSALREFGSDRRIFTFGTLALALLSGLVPERLVEGSVRELEDYSASYIRDIRSIPVRNPVCDLLVCLALEEAGRDTSDFREAIGDTTDAAGTMPSVISGDTGIGARGDAAASAAYLCFVIDKV